MIYFILGFITCLLVIGLIVYFFYKTKLSKYNNFFEMPFSGLDFIKGGEKDE